MKIRNNKRTSYALALLLAVVNDILDLLDFAQPVEGFLDLFTAMLIYKLITGKKADKQFLFYVLADLIPFIDMVPFMTLYVLNKMGSEPELGLNFDLKEALKKAKKTKIEVGRES